MRGLRIGVVSPFSTFSRRVRTLIEDRGFPVIELKLFEPGKDEGSTLAEFREEVVVTQALDADIFPHLDLVFFGGEGSEGASEHAATAAEDGVVTVVYGNTDVSAPILLHGVNDKLLSKETRLIRAARAPSILLGTVLAALTRSLEVREARATVLLPASDKGDEGIEELHQQVVKMLNFQSPPTDVFAEQLAFNLLVGTHDETMSDPNETIEKESSEIAGMDGGVSVMSVQAPVFHGYALALWVCLADDVTTDIISKAIRASNALQLTPSGGKSSKVPSPVGVSESDKVHVGWIRRDQSKPGGFWLWVVADGMAVDPAMKVIPLVEKLLGINVKH
jgi:aspartate-semialdehyde dehydrogenase